jgi:hypothetical protein
LGQSGESPKFEATIESARPSKATIGTLIIIIIKIMMIIIIDDDNNDDHHH